MDRIDKRSALMEKLQQELERRTKVEEEAVRLIGECEFEKAKVLLEMLDDEIVRQIEKELDGLHDENTSEESAENGKDADLNWVVLAIPEDCKSIFICMDERMFDERMKKGLIPLYDARKMASVPCFIAYAPTSNLTHLDTLAGL